MCKHSGLPEICSQCLLSVAYQLALLLVQMRALDLSAAARAGFPIPAELEAAEAERQAIADEIERVTSALSQLQAGADGLDTFIRKSKAKVAPIQNLPVELISDILMCVSLFQSSSSSGL